LGSIISSIRVWLWPLTKRDLTGWSLQKVRDSLIRLAAKMGKTRVQMRGMKGQLKEVIDSYLGYVFLGKNHPKIIVRKTLLLEEGIIERKGSTNITTHDSPRWIFQKKIGDDSTEWLSRACQYFEFQENMEEQKVAQCSSIFSPKGWSQPMVEMDQAGSKKWRTRDYLELI